MSLWLIIIPGSLGDAILTTGIIEWTRNRYAGSRFVIAAPSSTHALFGDLPNVEKIISFNKKKHELHWLTLWNQVKSISWEGIIDFRGSAICYVLKSKKRFIRRSLTEFQQKQHRVVQLALMIKKEAGGTVPSPTLWIAPERENIAKRLLGEKPTLGLAPITRWPGKQWPVDRFLAVAKES